MIETAILFVIGAALLVVGADTLVSGASAVAARYGISPMVIGLTIVAYGTSLPEFVVSAKAALDGSGGVAMGNVLGSNICNIALVLGLVAIFKPVPVNVGLIKRELPFLAVVSLTLVEIAYNGEIGRGEGALLLGLGIIYTMALLIYSKRDIDVYETEVPGHPQPEARGRNAVKIAVGCVCLFAGGHWFVESAIDIARIIGVSEAVIGLSLVAIGTSLPELVTAVVAVLRGEHDIGVGNLVGSNIFNMTAVLGGASLIAPIPFDRHANSLTMIVALLLPMVLLLPMLDRRRCVGRFTGLGLLLSYLLFVGILIVSS